MFTHVLGLAKSERPQPTPTAGNITGTPKNSRLSFSVSTRKFETLGSSSSTAKVRLTVLQSNYY